MRFIETPLEGAFVIEPERLADERGFFARTFCRDEMRAAGLAADIAQTSVAYNERAGTLRGMHYQVPPAAETKIVRCTRGRVHDVIVDVRPESATYLQHHSVELSADNRLALYVPEMFAHGYQSLTDATELLYDISVPFSPENARGIRYDDPALAIDWPRPVTVISPKDRAWPALAHLPAP